ncbi:MAG TPA: hypothetical protein VN688_11650 [Gemmataceae bacterium]|nr:hypothetical protein [Gemmataceae bacterium]
MREESRLQLGVGNAKLQAALFFRARAFLLLRDCTMRTLAIHPVRQRPIFLAASIVVLAALGCGTPMGELEKARRGEAEATKRLQECQAELAQTRKELEAVRKSPAKATGEDAANDRWKAARLGAQVFLEALNSRNAANANAAGTKDFQEKKGGTKAIDEFSSRRFRGEGKGYTCGSLTNFEAVPGQDEFVGRGKLQYRGVPRQDSTYTVRVVKEGDKWRVASFSVVER